MDQLRAQGITDGQLALVARRQEPDADGTSPVARATEQAAAEITRGTLQAAGVGALLGLAASAIPGVGPFIAAGTLLGGALGTAGGTAGLIASALTRAGFEAQEAQFYGQAVERGGLLVIVEAEEGQSGMVRRVLDANGGRPDAAGSSDAAAAPEAGR